MHVIDYSHGAMNDIVIVEGSKEVLEALVASSSKNLKTITAKCQYRPLTRGYDHAQFQLQGLAAAKEKDMAAEAIAAVPHVKGATFTKVYEGECK